MLFFFFFFFFDTARTKASVVLVQNSHNFRLASPEAGVLDFWSSVTVCGLKFLM